MHYKRDVKTINEPGLALAAARRLKHSSSRRLISNLVDFRDWPTYIWLFLFAVLLYTVPFTLYQLREKSIQQGHILSAVAQTSPLYRDVLRLLQDGIPPRIPPIQFEEVDTIEPLDFTGYDVVSDDRIYDLRGWEGDHGEETPARMFARFRFRRTEEAIDRPSLKIQLPSENEEMRAEFLPLTLQPSHVRTQQSDGTYLYETSLDFSSLPIDSDTAVIARQELPQMMASETSGIGRFKFTIAAKTGLCRIRVLLPKDRPHDQFQLFRRPLDHSEPFELVEATTTVSLPIGSVAAFELINPENGFRYEVRWRWTEDGTD